MPGFENQEIIVRGEGFFSSRMILQNGTPVPRAKRPNQYLLRDDKGQDVVAEFKAWQTGPLPTVLINGQIVPPGRRIDALEWIVAGLPNIAQMYVILLLLLFVQMLAGETVINFAENAIGLGLELIGLNYGIAVLQGELQKPLKYTIACCIFLVTVLILGGSIALTPHIYHHH